MFEKIHIDSTTREEIIESLEDFNNSAIPTLTSKSGTKFLEERYEDLDKPKYLGGLLDVKGNNRAITKKLESKDMFSQKFIDNLRYSFEHIFQIIKEQLAHYDDEKFCEEQMKKFEKLKRIYKKMYPDTNFDFNALLKGETPYGNDYVH